MLDKEKVKAAAAGHWHEILYALAPALHPALEHPGRHVPCPVHGGKNGFRLFPTYRDNGACICNSCGACHDGFATLKWVNKWDFKTAVERVGSYLGLCAGGTPLEAEELSYEGVLLHCGSVRLGSKSGTGIKLQTRTGIRTLWGVDLVRACDVAGAVKGNLISASRIGKTQLRNGRTFNSWVVRLLKTEAQKDAEARAHEEQKRLNREAICSVWNASVPVTEDCPAGRYLAHRGIALKDYSVTGLRFNESECAMIAAVRDAAGKCVTLHKTYLTPNGRKADVAHPKLLMKLAAETMSGAAIRLAPHREVLALAEGIETALSVTFATGIPCWSTVSATGLEAVHVPEEVKTVLVFADKDRSETGGKAAKKLVDRLSQIGKLAVVVCIEEPIPEGAKGIDWNDVLQKHGKSAFPIGGSGLSE